MNARARRLIAIVLVALAAGQALVFLYTQSASGVRDRLGRVRAGDFLQFYAAGKTVADGRGGRLYDAQAFAETQRPPSGPLDRGDAFRPLYPPQTAVMFAPLGALAYATAAWLWMGLFAVCVAAATAMLVRSSRRTASDRRLLWLACAAFPPAYVGLYLGQLSALLLLILAAGAIAYVRGRNVCAGIVLGFLCLKPPFAAAVVLWALLAGRWRLLLGFCGSAAALAAVTAGILGWSAFAEYLESARVYAELGTIYRFAAFHQHGLGGALVGAFGREQARLCLVAHAVVVGAAVAVRQLRVQKPGFAGGDAVGSTDGRSNGSRRAQEDGLLSVAPAGDVRAPEQRRRGELVFLGCLAMLITPHLLTYDLLLVLVPFGIAFGGDDVSPQAARARTGVGLLFAGATLWPLYGLTGISLFPFLALYAVCRLV